jgi:NAD(P)-dependent dehydrogenase (short-subunit alcohol dehydrogenase family)
MSKGVALVTGAAKRIGAAIAARLAGSGYAVVLHAHASIPEAEALAETLRRAGGHAATIAGDLADLDGLPALMAKAGEPFGPVTLLINNASIFERDDISTIAPELFSRHLAVNLQAPVLLARAFAEQVPDDRKGAVINIIDQRVLKPNPLFLSYSISKAGLFWATKTLAQSLAPRIRVNAVGPGPVLPNVHEGAALFNKEASETLLGAIIPPEAIAEAALFLAEAENITGQMLAVDSGQHLAWQTPDIFHE